MMTFHCKLCINTGPNGRSFEPIKYHMWVKHLTGPEHQENLKNKVSLSSLRRAYALEEDKYVIIGLPKTADERYMYTLAVWVSEFGVLTEFFYLQRLGACIVTVQACGIGRRGKGIERAQSLCNEVHFKAQSIKVYRKETLFPVDWNDILKGNFRRLLSEKLSTEFVYGVVERDQAQDFQEPGGDAGERLHYKSPQRKFRESKGCSQSGKMAPTRRKKDTSTMVVLPIINHHKGIPTDGEDNLNEVTAPAQTEETKADESNERIQFSVASAAVNDATISLSSNYVTVETYTTDEDSGGDGVTVIEEILNEEEYIAEVSEPLNALGSNGKKIKVNKMDEEAMSKESPQSLLTQLTDSTDLTDTIVKGFEVSESLDALKLKDIESNVSKMDEEAMSEPEESSQSSVTFFRDSTDLAYSIAKETSQPLDGLKPREQGYDVVIKEEEAIPKEVPQSQVTLETTSKDSTDLAGSVAKALGISEPLDELKPQEEKCNASKMGEEGMLKEVPQSLVTASRDGTDTADSVGKISEGPVSLGGLEPKEEFNATKTDEEAMFGGSPQSSVTTTRDSTDSGDSVITVTSPQRYQYMKPEETNIILRGIEDPVKELKSTIHEADPVREEDEEPDYMKYVLYWYNKF